jgi:hypothetical protein
MFETKDREKMIDTLRSQANEETEKQAKKARFGLFSQPPPLAVGDTSYFNPKKANKNEAGKPITEVRGIYAVGSKTGKSASNYFNRAEYVGEPYVDPSRRALIEAKNNKKRGSSHDAEFKPASGYKTVIAGSFKHETDYTEHKKTKNVDATGKVITGPANITSKPGKKGHYATTTGHLFGKAPEFLKDEYDRPKELRYKENQEKKKKMQEQAFKVNDHGDKNFQPDKKLYGLDKELPPVKEEKKVNVEEKGEKRDPFKPSNPPKKGYNATINKFPEYKGDPEKVILKKKEPEEKKESFKNQVFSTYAKPSPSVTLNTINIRREIATGKL